MSCFIEQKLSTLPLYMTPISKARSDYLKSDWKAYPGIHDKVFTIKDFVKKFADMSSGKDKLKAEHFFIAGRIEKQPGQEAGQFYYSITSQDETLGLEILKTCTLSEKSNINEILETGDQILVKALWQDVRVEGYDAKVKMILAHEITLLAPCLEPYSIDNFNYKKSKQWQFFLQQIRRVFQVLDFVEVHTPTLVKAPGTETFLDHFTTEFQMGKSKETFYLPTSPELHLKKMISLGWNRIYEIKNCFRNGELSEKHQPEFWMLEWYRSYATFDSLIKDIQGILNFIKLHWPEPINGFTQLKITSIPKLFYEHLQFELKPTTTIEDLRTLAKDNKIDFSKTDSWDDLFYRIFIEKIEASLGYDAPTIVKDYPPSQAALAKINADGWADRFEFYWMGLEIANAFYELNDPVEQEKRFYEDIETREKIGRTKVPVDEEFLRALRAGFPPSTLR